MSATNNFTVTPKIGSCTLDTAELSTDGTSGETKLLFTAGANGSQVRRIIVKCREAFDGVVRLFVNNGSDPSTAENNKFFKDVAINQPALAADAATIVTEIELDDCWLAATQNLRACITVDANTEGVDVTAWGGDL